MDELLDKGRLLGLQPVAQPLDAVGGDIRLVLGLLLLALPPAAEGAGQEGASNFC